MPQLRRWVPGAARGTGTAAVGMAQAAPANTDLARVPKVDSPAMKPENALPRTIRRVSLSDLVRGTMPSPVQAPPDSAPAIKTPEPSPLQDQRLRRNGFEVAKGMISAAIKSELSSWRLAGEHGGPAALEARLLARVSQIEAPFRI